MIYWTSGQLGEDVENNWTFFSKYIMQSRWLIVIKCRDQMVVLMPSLAGHIG